MGTVGAGPLPDAFTTEDFEVWWDTTLRAGERPSEVTEKPCRAFVPDMRQHLDGLFGFKIQAEPESANLDRWWCRWHQPRRYWTNRVVKLPG